MTRLEAKAGMDKRTTLQSLCEMRCSNCDNALYTFKSALEFLEDDGDGKSRNYLLSIQRFHLIITLVTNYLRSKMTTESIWGCSRCTSTRTQSWMLNASFISSVVRRTSS